MGYYRKKPVVIEAVLWNGTMESISEIAEFVDKTVEMWHGEVRINTLEGLMIASPGDWIIKGVKGEFYPCAPDIFEATYEEVESIDT